MILFVNYGGFGLWELCIIVGCFLHFWFDTDHSGFSGHFILL